MVAAVRARWDTGGVVSTLALAIAYVAVAELGFAFAFSTKQVTAVWPPTGLAVAALLLFGNRVWPGIWLGAFASNALRAEPLWAAALIAAGNTVAPLAATGLFRRFGGIRTDFERVRDVLLFALLGAAAMLVSATNGVAILSLAGIVPWHEAAGVWWVWWAGDSIGVLLVGTTLLAWAAGIRDPATLRDRLLERGIFLLALLPVTWLSFLSNAPARVSLYPFLIWSSLRLRQRDTALTVLIVSGVAVWATAHGFGPWVAGAPDQRLLQTDTWMAVYALTGLVLGAVMAERRAARHALLSLLDETQRAAVTLQGAFLPERLPQRVGLRSDALYIAAEREALIGGDWYDGFELPDGRLIVSIGDVAGHGLVAAVSAARLRRAIFAAAFDSADPADILATVDRRAGTHDTVATALVAVFDRDLRSMEYASAGHPPPILAGPTTPVHALSFGGVPFGAGLPVQARTHSVALERGSVIVFYTDGLIEFDRTIERAEAALRKATGRLVAAPRTTHPATFVQRAVMGTKSAVDDTVLLVVQLEAELRRTWTYDSRDPHAATALRRDIAAFLRLYSTREDDLYLAEIVVGEALANTVEHAPGSVRVDVNWTQTHPVVTVADCGPGMADASLALPSDPLSETGRGIYLIESLAKEVSVERSHVAGTTLRIVLPLAR